ncbi:putative phage abortive infection protein [Providencia alcalifaciens]
MKFKKYLIIVAIVVLILIMINFYIDDTSIKVNSYAACGAFFAAFIALETLRMTKSNNEKNNFDNRFNLLLEQHNEQLNNVIDFIDKNITNSEISSKLTDSYDYSKPNDYLFSHPIFSPYMRILYHILKSIYIDYRLIDKKIESEKKYSSLVRSLIRNDLLYFIAINVISNKNTNFNDFTFYLNRYDFFEHLNLNKPLHHVTNSYQLESFDKVLNVISNNLNDYIDSVIKVAIIRECNLCDYLFNNSLNDLDDDFFYIKTPSIYRFYFLFNTLEFNSMNKKLKETLKIKISAYNISTKIKKHKLIYKQKIKYLFLGCEKVRHGYVYCQSGTDRIYLKNELASIIKNKEDFNMFCKRIAINYNIPENEILFSTVSNKTVSSLSQYMSAGHLYQELIKYNVSNIVSTKEDSISHNVITHLEIFLNSQRIFTDQNDNLNFESN